MRKREKKEYRFAGEKTPAKALLLIFILVLVGQTLFGQKKLPLIKATSKEVDIRDGDTLRKDAWTISPQLKPDRYITQYKNRKVTFYTNLDSISFVVKPNEKYDFTILLNNKDSALTEIVYQPTYLETLKKAGKYNLTEKRELPKFTYQSSDNPHLMALRKAFNLDSIAGTGNEVSKILSLMHWIHNLIPHDGNHSNPEVMNAMNMIAVCKKESRGLNCRGMATVLNECYLSMGFKSRFITCLPKDSLKIDNDCHVINMVYSSELKKWLWIDPTFDAYVMNEKGELLSIEEVRERIINGKPLILNPEANWNHKTSQTKGHYLYYYMAKNLYLLECPMTSEYDTETKQEGKLTRYMELVPLDYFNKSLEKNESMNNETKRKWETYKTNNPNVFWEAP
jgi:hypothetical protein